MASYSFPPFTDLRTLAADLEGSEQYRRLRSAIEKAARTQSCLSDLAQAATCCDALEELLPSPRKKGTLNRSAIEASLLQTGVTLYERATSAAGKRGERGSISIIDHLTDEQRSDHDALVNLRQRALAHVYIGEPINGEVWHRDVLFAVKVEDAWKPAAASHSLQFDRATFVRLKRQIPAANAILTTRYHTHTNALTAILNENPVAPAAFEKHQFDPVGLFGSARAVQAGLDGQLRIERAF